VNYDDILKLVVQQCRQQAFKYKQHPDELESFCFPKIVGLMARLDTSQPLRSQQSFIRRSVNGYCLHWLRDHATLIKTPRDASPFTMVTIDKQRIASESPVTDLPDYISSIMLYPNLRKRIANAYLHYLDND